MSGAAGLLATVVGGVVGGEPPIRLRAWDGTESGPAGGPVLVVNDPQALRRLLWQPNELGLAQAYVTKEIDVEGDIELALRTVWRFARTSLPDGVRVGVPQRMRALTTAIKLGAFGLPPAPPEVQAQLDGDLHSRERDRAAIAHHYDLSNEFYALLLDETMAYSCAYFTADGMSLADAQRAKLDLICTKLGLKPGMRLLDVGCGWGSLTAHAAEHYGVEVVAVTLAAQQHAFVTARVAAAGLDHLVQVRLSDYRDIADTGFDAVATVEMGEHVGEDKYPAFIRGLRDKLQPGGRLLVQQMSRGANRPGGGAFIESYIAPDMHMRPVGETVAMIERAGLEVRHVEALREHYTRTARAWLATLEERWDAVVDLVGEPTARVWRLYLVGGALAFEERRMGVDQILAVRDA
ncbi:cyclopropane-fatty-acyl-phospholipid synthase [Allocatelliglobosispora scoriae]|uniref:Cyclopropane-fatty-acyl-phospholipid synthase n=1 Tax=Allocatelliglobosispora scoriae TaxID=643052 RepID=A0A841BZR5_9ACTN|nr:cyclopropane-fatty-acyl-phospholipid synthase family protein [Allocatelliglobosispora scoriae]MBB5873086.1 cyclopropane-fatty-acyl-phospholipid synthase [Allocatelliglobosispora scoriae]